MLDAVQEVRTAEEEEEVDDGGEPLVSGGARRRKRAPELYHEADIARINLRFSVGDEVRCSVENSIEEGVVIKRFYREQEWPREYYAAVNTTRSNTFERSPWSCPSFLTPFCSPVFFQCFLSVISQYQVRLHRNESDGATLIYAPRDEDCYIMSAAADPDEDRETNVLTIHIDRRLSLERRLMRKLEASLDRNPDERKNSDKRLLYDKVRRRHKQAMQRIIDDICRGAAVSVA